MNQYAVYDAMLRAVESLRLSIDVSEAMSIYSNYIRAKSVGRRSRKLLAYASLYTLIRLRDIPLTLTRFAEIVGVNARILSACYKDILEALDLRHRIDLERYVDYIVEYIGRVHVKHKAIEMLEYIKRIDAINGKNPIGVAGAVVCIACDKDNPFKYMKEVSQLTGMSTVTLKKRVKELYELLVCI
jgi:transcription initiation factor TFIIB